MAQTNNTDIDPNTPLLTTPTSHIMEYHFEVNQPEGSSLVTVKDLLEDPHIQPGMMQSAMSAVTSLFTPNSTQPPESNDPIVHHKVSVSSTPKDTDKLDINKELNTYKDRLALELNKFQEKVGNTK